MFPITIYLKKLITFFFLSCSEQIRAEQIAAQKKENPSIFGIGCERTCICMVPGQLPCPGVVKLPDHMRGKFKYNKD